MNPSLLVLIWPQQLQIGTVGILLHSDILYAFICRMGIQMSPTFHLTASIRARKAILSLPGLSGMLW